MSMIHVEERLVSYLRGELEAAERAAIEAHLAACPVCRQALADFQRLAADLARLPAPAVHWGAYRADLRNKLERRERPRRSRWIWLPVPAAALAAGLAALFLYLGPYGQEGRDELATADQAQLATHLDVIARLDMVQQLDLLEDFEVISRLDDLDRS